MRGITRRLASLSSLIRPLTLTFIGVVLLSLGVAYLVIHAYRTIEGVPGFFYWLTLQFLPRPFRGVLLFLVGLGVIAAGLWQLSGVAVINLRANQTGELVLGFDRQRRRSRIVVLSGGAGMLVLGNLSEHVERLTCIVPLQDPVEYYYRASGLLNAQNVYYVVPTPLPVQVVARLDDGTTLNVKQVDLDMKLAERHVDQLSLQAESDGALQIARLAREALAEADAILLGPGSLFESIVPNLLIEEFARAVRESKALKIYLCNLMTEPGLTTHFSVGDHIREIKRYGGFIPDYVLVNAQRIEPEIYQLYAAAHQSPVYLAPEDYEETTVMAGDRVAERRLVVEGSTVIEADLSTSVVQYTALLDKPGESRAVSVLRHDGQKLSSAILELLRRT
jgi:2-phospho-L-lactate transferase/gluconeogenesis factor (CofD/UPF0052 family)